MRYASADPSACPRLAYGRPSCGEPLAFASDTVTTIIAASTSRAFPSTSRALRSRFID
jgi:hypothetical protein